MRLFFGSPLGNSVEARLKWCVDALQKMQTESMAGGVEKVAQDYTVTNFTESRTLDASTASAADIANFLGTLIQDIARGGTKRT